MKLEHIKDGETMEHTGRDEARTSRGRVLTSLSFREPDRLPFDLGGMAQSGMHHLAYSAFRAYLGLPTAKPRLLNIITQAARMDDDFLAALGVDTAIAYGKWADPDAADVHRERDFLQYTDEWGVRRRMHADGGLYYDLCGHPLDAEDFEAALQRYCWPDAVSDARFAGLQQEAAAARESGRFVTLMGLCPGIFEMAQWLRGFQGFLMDLACEPGRSEALLGRLADLKIAYWLRALQETNGLVDAVNEADDLAAQDSLLVSPETYRRCIKPHHQRIIQTVKQSAPGVKVLFHSCGAVRPLLPDLIEIGVDVLNPVQLSAAGMEPRALKRDFGREIAFWGGGVDTQRVLASGTPRDVRDDVRRNIDALAPGGGYVFSPVHIIQPNVPPENVMAMWEEFRVSDGPPLRPALSPD